MGALVSFSLSIALFLVFGLGVVAIQKAAEEPIPGVFIYLAILGIVAGLGGGITFLMQGLRASKKKM